MGTLLVGLALGGALGATPLFPEDAEARAWLRRFGLSGSRATSRWEVALQLAQLDQQMRQGWLVLASREEVHQWNRLLESYREELQQLGVRLEGLEEKVSLLDQRVEELGRIRFSGKYRASYVAMGVSNGGNGAQNYAQLAGSIQGANLTPLNTLGTQPVLDYGLGRPLLRESGLSQVLLLTVETEPAPDWLAEMRVFAYSSQGGALTNAVWGVQPPLQANPFGLNVAPYTSAGLDRLSLANTDGSLAVAIGSFSPRFMSPQIYLGEVNPRVGNPRVLDSYGFQVMGELDNGRWGWEAFGSRLFDGNPGLTTPYRSYALGGALQYHNQEWTIGLSGLRAYDDNLGGALVAGQTTNFNQFGGLGNLNWVNPPGYWAAQVNASGAGTQTDQRPLGGLAGSDAGGARATTGPQSISMGGIHAEYVPKGYSLVADYAFSDYRPSRFSGYSTRGSLWRLGGSVDLLPEVWKLELDYRFTDARYDPMLLQFGSPVAGVTPLRVYHRFPDQDQFWLFWSLHNTDTFPHNRQGLWLTTRVQYDPDGAFSLSYRNLQQVTTSLQDVRYRLNGLGPGLPNADVLGFSPGFIDVVFREFSPLSFDANFLPLENPRGSVQSLGAKISHVFTGTPWKLEAGYDAWSFQRGTSLPASLGGSQNRVDLKYELGHLDVSRRFGEDWLVTLGCQQARIHGHYDPGGIYNDFAIANQSVDFLTRDLVQTMPFLKVDWNVDGNVRVGAEAMYYFTQDRVPASVVPGPLGGTGQGAHPFAWNGFRYSTTLEIDF